MARKDQRSIRNIGVIAHIDAGKTTLSERILFYCQKIHKLGEVHDGAATMDFLPEEQERGITITSACTTCLWNGTSINLVDTPGHVDFTIEVERCLRVLDGAIGVFCAVGGVEPQSETVWRQSEHFNVPKIAFVNKMDRDGADFEAALESMRQRLGANPAAVTVPLGQGAGFSGVLDIITREKITFDPADQGQTVIRAPFSKEEEKLAAPWRDAFLEKLAEADDRFLALWLDGSFSIQDVTAALKRSVLARKLTPVYCGSALRNMGVQPLLDAICDYLPSPLEVPPAEGITPHGDIKKIESNPDNPPLALVFKVIMESGRKHAFIRLYSGKIHEGDMLCSAHSGKQDRVGRLYRLHADRKEQLQEVCAGDIAAVIGLRNAHTGETWCAKNHEITLEAINSYAPVITLALEPRNSDEGKILDEALNRYLEEDPTLKLSVDEDSGMRMLSGMGELHMEVVLERLAREYKITPRSGQPQVVMRETLRGRGAASADFDRELGKERHQGHVELEVAPLPRNSGNKVEVGDFLPADRQEARKILPEPFLQAVLEGVRDGLQSGVISGWPVVDVAVAIKNIGGTEGLSTIPGLRMAAGLALREALSKASPVALEPIMDVEITTPEEFLGSAISLFNQTGGKIENMADHGGSKRINGAAPLRNLFGFSTRLRSATQGRAGFMLAFRKFDTPC